MKYRAFISYSHQDERWAAWLHRRLETYRVPKRLVGQETLRGPVPARLNPVFRDRDELATATDLGSTIREALDESAAMVVVCSPAAAASRWVNEEILTFKRLGREADIFCFIVAGEPNAAFGEVDTDQECFPPALRYRLGADGRLSRERVEPVAADAREGKDGRGGAFTKLLAGLLGLGLDELRQRDQQRRQRRLALVAAAAFAGMLITSGLAAVALLSRAEAVHQRGLAEIEAETASQTTRFLVSLFEVADPSEARGNTITAREILDRGARRIESELSGQPAVQANLLDTMGQVYTGLGLYEPATRFLEQAEELRAEISASPDASRIETANSLGTALYLKGEYEAAESVFRDALAAARQLSAAPDSRKTRAMNGLADVYTQFERDAEAEALYREALAMDRELHGFSHPDVARSLAGLATLLIYQSRFEEAESLLREALAIRVNRLGDDHPLVAETGNNLASLYYFVGNAPAAEREFREALRRYRHIYGDEHPEVSSIINNLGRVLLEQDRVAEAEPLLREALAIDRKLKDPGHDDLVFPLNSLGLALARLGRDEEAEAFYTEALQVGRLHDHRMQGPVLSNLSDLYCRTGRHGAAAPLLQEAEALLKRDYPDEDWRLANLASIRGACLAAGGDVDAARPLLASSVGPIRARWGDAGLFTRLAVCRMAKTEAAGAMPAGVACAP